jgi:transposase, IS5 family
VSGKYDVFMVPGQHKEHTDTRDGLRMSRCFSGLDIPCGVQPVTMDISPTHPLIQLAHVIPGQVLTTMVWPDRQRTTAKGQWWLGRKLMRRIHLGAFWLQWLDHLTDRQVDWAIKDHAADQLFCGRGVVDTWRPPDHTKMEAFRSRLAPETPRPVAKQVAGWATALGCADPSKRDVDSTIPKAHMASPSAAQLMVKMTLVVNKGWTYRKKNVACFADVIPTVDVKAVQAQAKASWFRDRQHTATTPSLWQALGHESLTQISHVRPYFDARLDDDIQRLPWNIRRSLDQVHEYCSTHVLHVASLLCRGVVVPDNALSCHTPAVSCCNKGQAANGLQLGRAFQLGRLGGTFRLVAACTARRMEDTASVRPMIRTHQEVGGQDVLASCGRDQGYDSHANHQYVPSLEGRKACCLQPPGLEVSRLGEDAAETSTRLVNRRAGLEPLIGHAKQGGQLGQSRRKTDETTLAAGDGAIGGFNLRQFIRHLLGKDIKPMG